MAKKIKYNLSGHGQLTINLYPYAEKLFSVLIEHNYDAKFNQTNQLGALKRVLPGAHYTRYEYILLQWYLIHELKQRDINSGLGSNSSALKTLETDELKAEGLKGLTGGDLLQCLVLLTNMGHFPDTFSASRVWLRMLKNNTMKVREGVLNGLETDEKALLRKLLASDDVHYLHYCNALFMLNRLRNSAKSKHITSFASRVLIKYANGDNEDFQKYWKTYSMIRNLAYLILDSSYAPIPLNIELASVISNMEQIFGKNINSNSPMSTAIKQLDKVLEDTVYLAGNSLIATAIRSAELEKNFLDNGCCITLPNGSTAPAELHRLSVVRDILEPTHKNSNFLSSLFNQYSSYENPPINWDMENCLEIKYSHTNIYSDLFPSEHYAWEKELHIECGVSACNVAVFGTPSKDHLRFVYSRNVTRPEKTQVSSLCKFISRIIDNDIKYEKYGYSNDFKIENLKNVFEFMMKALLNWGYEVTFEWQDIKNSQVTPFFVGHGSKTIASKISDYIDKASSYVSDDLKNEFECTKTMLNEMSYRGLILAYVGVTKLWDGNKSTPIAEFDGIVIYPNLNNGVLLSIVEGKNQSNGQTEARRQLINRMMLLEDIYEYSLTDIGRKGAFSAIKLKV